MTLPILGRTDIPCPTCKAEGHVTAGGDTPTLRTLDGEYVCLSERSAAVVSHGPVPAHQHRWIAYTNAAFGSWCGECGREDTPR